MVVGRTFTRLMLVKMSQSTWRCSASWRMVPGAGFAAAKGVGQPAPQCAPRELGTRSTGRAAEADQAAGVTPYDRATVVMPRVTAVEILEDFKVRLTFKDRTVGSVDLADIIGEGPIFEPLQDRAYFAKVRVSRTLGTMSGRTGPTWRPRHCTLGWWRLPRLRSHHKSHAYYFTQDVLNDTLFTRRESSFAPCPMLTARPCAQRADHPGLPARSGSRRNDARCRPDRPHR
jgi:hypothetical protein